MNRRLSFDEFQLNRKICLWAIDSGLADGNPWIIRLALSCGEDHGWRIRVWRPEANSTYSESFVNLAPRVDSLILWRLWAMHQPKPEPPILGYLDSDNSFEKMLDLL